MNGIVLGGEHSFRMRVHGDIVECLQWVNDEPALVIWPKNRQNVPAFIVCMSSAFKYDDLHYLAAQARHVCGLWGFDDRSHWYRLATVVHDALEDLVRMPPAPSTYEDRKRSTASIGELSVTGDGKLLGETEVKLPEADERVTYQ
jgi:hypothetical protein